MAFTDPDPMPDCSSGNYHLYSAAPDGTGNCSWCGQTEYPYHAP